MTEIFLTDIKTHSHVKEVTDFLKRNSPRLTVTFDLNESGNPFPCGHTVLRIEADTVDREGAIAAIKNLGFNCETLEDKVCN